MPHGLPFSLGESFTDYRDRIEDFEKSDNVFAVVVAVHLRTLETKNDKLTRRQEKARLTRALCERGFERKDIASLYHFIDWIMVLPRELEDEYNREMIEFEEENISLVSRAWEEKKKRRKNVMEDILTVHIPNEIRRTLNRTSKEMERDIRLYSALMLFRIGKLSSGAASLMAGIPRVMFLDLCSEYDIPVSQITAEELRREAGNG